MTWEEQLFSVLDDLEGQAEALFQADRDAELADRTRSEYTAVTLASRLMASVGDDVVVTVSGMGPVRGMIQRVCADWFLLSTAMQEWVVRTAAVVQARGAAERSVPEAAWSPVARLGFGSALRRVAEERQGALVYLVDGSRLEARVERVGQDFVEVSVGSQAALVPFTAIAAVQRRD